MSSPVYQFLDDLGTQAFTDIILDMVNEQLDDGIVGELSEDAKDDQMLSSAASIKITSRLMETVLAIQNRLDQDLFDYLDETDESIDDKVEAALNEGINNLIQYVYENEINLTHLKIVAITGDIETMVTDPDPETIYIQHDSDTDYTWKLYINDGTWREVGESKYDLANYWSKDENDTLVETFYKKALGLIDVAFIAEHVPYAYEQVMKYIQFENPLLCALTVADSSLVMETESNDTIDVTIDDSGCMILNEDEPASRLENELSKFTFDIANGELIATYTE